MDKANHYFPAGKARKWTQQTNTGQEKTFSLQVLRDGNGELAVGSSMLWPLGSVSLMVHVCDEGKAKTKGLSIPEDIEHASQIILMETAIEFTKSLQGASMEMAENYTGSFPLDGC